MVLIFLFMIMGLLLISEVEVGKFAPLDRFMFKKELLFFPYLLIALWLCYSIAYFMTMLMGREYLEFYHQPPISPLSIRAFICYGMLVVPILFFAFNLPHFTGNGDAYIDNFSDNMLASAPEAEVLFVDVRALDPREHFLSSALYYRLRETGNKRTI